MIYTRFKKYIIIILSIIFCFIIITYVENKKLLVFNQIEIKNDSQEQNIIQEFLFNYINYNPDSIYFYSNTDYEHFFKKIKNLETKNGIIKNINFYYSLPNKIVFDIQERNPSFLIKYKNKTLFALDDSGMIIDVQFLSSEIPEVHLTFDDFYLYNISNNSIQTNNFKDIDKDRLNNQCLLDAFTVLNSFDKLGLADLVDSLILKTYHHGDLESSLDSYIYTIKIDLSGTKIQFIQDNTLEDQIKKFELLVNNLEKNIDRITFNEISDLSEVRLDINQQIVYKEK